MHIRTALFIFYLQALFTELCTDDKTAKKEKEWGSRSTFPVTEHGRSFQFLPSFPKKDNKE